MALAFVSILASTALANPKPSLTVRFTKYNIDSDDGLLGGNPDPSLVLTVGGGQSTQIDIPFSCGSVVPPGTGCIFPPPPPNGWFDFAFTTSKDFVYRVGARDAEKVPVIVSLIDRDPGADTLRLLVSLTVNLYDKTIVGLVPANGQQVRGVAEEEICAWNGPNGVCFVISGVGDSDGDGLLDVWEQAQSVPTETGPLPLPDADPRHKDIYVQLNWTSGFQPTKAVIDRLKDAFARAPANAGGVMDTEQGVRLHIDTGGLTETVGGVPVLVGDNYGGGSELAMIDPRWCGLADKDGDGPGVRTFFQAIKAAVFDPKRIGIFHYAVSKDIVDCDPCALPSQIVDATNTSPIVITTASEHNLNTGSPVLIAGVNGNTAANSKWTITALTDKTVSLDTSTGSGAYSGGGTMTFTGSGGCGEVGGDDMVFALRLSGVTIAGGNTIAAGNRDAATFMHELGHNLGFQHGGFEKHNCKPNYMSVMNYFYGDGIPTDSRGTNALVDYFPPLTAAAKFNPPDPLAERIELAVLRESALDETIAFNTNADWVFRYMTFVNGLGFVRTRALYNDLFDWDGDGRNDKVSAQANIDINPMSGGFPSCNSRENLVITDLVPSEDWTRMSMRFTAATDSTAGPSSTPSSQEPTEKELDDLQKARSASDLAVAIVGPPVVQVGQEVDVTVTVTNNGPNFATGTLTVDVPPGIRYLSDTGTCSSIAPGRISCPVTLGPGESIIVVVRYSIEANTSQQTRYALAVVTNTSGVDPIGLNNQAMVPLQLPPTVVPPPPVTTDQCAAPMLGTATATAEVTGPVTIANNAPPLFPLGVTVVSWTATDSRGVTGSANQTVTTTLGNFASCCPPGTRIILGTSGSDNLIGTPSNECIIGLGGSDQIQGGGGFDFISGGSGDDNVTGGPGRDYIWGGSGRDVIDAAGGDDFIDGGPDADTCSGSTGANAILACETASFCNVSCCASGSCTIPLPPPALGCQTAYSKATCGSYVLGVVVSRGGHNWRCSNGNCSNCATFASCEPGGSGCPWGTVWTDQGTCP